MFWFVLLGFAVILTVVAMGVASVGTGSTRFWGIGAVFGIPILFVGISLLMAGHTVENGHIGVVKQFGAIKSTTGDGLNWIAPWRDIKQVSVRGELRTYVMDDRPGAPAGDANSGAAVSRDSQPIYLVIQMNSELVRAGAVEVFKETGGDYVHRILDPAVFQITKEATAKFKATQFAANREKIRIDIQNRLQREVGFIRVTGEDHKTRTIPAIQINSVALKNVDFTDDLSRAIEQTVEAEQQSKREEAKVAISQAQAQQRVARAEGLANAQIAEAKGKAESNLIQARADATANRLRSKSLSPILIQQQAIEALNPSVETIFCSAGVICIPNATPAVTVGSK